MARNQETEPCAPGVWTQLTNADVTTISFVALTADIEIRGAVGAVAPGNDDDGIPYKAGMGERQILLSSLFTTSGITRVYARPVLSTTAKVWVDHA